jgi:hypothetical protein
LFAELIDEVVPVVCEIELEDEATKGWQAFGTSTGARATITSESIDPWALGGDVPLEHGGSVPWGLGDEVPAEHCGSVPTSLSDDESDESISMIQRLLWKIWQPSN